MIRTHFGTPHNPFETNLKTPLLQHQEQHISYIETHSQQQGLTVLFGEPGTGKTILKHHLMTLHPDTWVTLVINRSMHTWQNILHLLAQTLDLETTGRDHKCEERILAEVRKLNQKGKTLILIIDDAHLIPIDALRKLRLLMEDFPKNHNLILLGQAELMSTLQLRPNADFLTRITYAQELLRLPPTQITDFILAQLDQAQLPHNTFTEAAINLINKSNGGNLRATKNLCLGGMIEAVRDQTKTVDIQQINSILNQPHWRHSNQLEGIEPLTFTNQRPSH